MNKTKTWAFQGSLGLSTIGISGAVITLRVHAKRVVGFFSEHVNAASYTWTGRLVHCSV
jgi:hypothetical protein